MAPEHGHPPSPGPLAGIRVVDLTSNLAGPFCAMTLADLGADVVKVERVGSGDDTRSWPTVGLAGHSATFAAANRSKRSIAVDFDTTDGHEVIVDLASRADVLVESFRPGTLQRRDLGYQQLRAFNRRLIYCSISGFPSKGPRREDPGYDPVVQAYTGIMDLTGWPDGPPARLGIGALDLGAALWATIGIQRALSERERTGEGALVEISLFETAVWWLSYHLGGYLAGGEEPQRAGTATAFIAPYETFPTADGLLMVAAGNDRLFATLVGHLGVAELAGDDRFASNAARVEHRTELHGLLSERFSTRTAAEWEAALSSELPCARVRGVADLAHDPTLQASGILRRTETGEGSLDLIDVPVTVAGSRSVRWSAPPELGEHTSEILHELGYSAGAIERMANAGAVRSPAGGYPRSETGG